MPNTSHPRSLLPELSAVPGRIADILDDLSNFERFWRPAEGKWSCAEVVGHLADAELVFGYRVRTALAESDKPLESFDQDKWVATGHWNDLPAETPLRAFVAQREALVAILAHLSDEEWDRRYVHAARGLQTIADTARLLVAHDARHLVQLGRTAEEAREAAKRGTRSQPR